MPQGSSSFADRAVLGIDRRQGDAGHRRRQGEREIDQRIDQALAGEAVADQYPGEDQAENDVDRGREQRGTKTELIRSHHPRAADGGPEGIPAHGQGLGPHRSERDEDDEGQIDQGVTHGQAEPG
jgi:hypothetical protein